MIVAWIFSVNTEAIEDILDDVEACIDSSVNLFSSNIC